MKSGSPLIMHKICSAIVEFANRAQRSTRAMSEPISGYDVQIDI